MQEKSRLPHHLSVSFNNTQKNMQFRVLADYHSIPFTNQLSGLDIIFDPCNSYLFQVDPYLNARHILSLFSIIYDGIENLELGKEYIRDDAIIFKIF
jgi:hypothetical protein